MNKHRHYSILPCDSFFFFTISATSDGCATNILRMAAFQLFPVTEAPEHADRVHSGIQPVSISVFVSPDTDSSCFIPSSRQMANAPSGAGFSAFPPARRAPHQNILSQRMSQYSQLLIMRLLFERTATCTPISFLTTPAVPGYHHMALRLSGGI